MYSGLDPYLSKVSLMIDCACCGHPSMTQHSVPKLAAPAAAIVGTRLGGIMVCFNLPRRRTLLPSNTAPGPCCQNRQGCHHG